jgi:hypothetical protein
MPLHPGYFLLEQIVETWKKFRRKNIFNFLKKGIVDIIYKLPNGKNWP